ncbi:MAG: hypothetical protein IPO78_17390 [Saprospiraceae bacterium]|nr:hypothetical protein [Saprospiraceae bacterium]
MPDIEEIKLSLRAQIKSSIEFHEDPDNSSWSHEVGILMSQNEAKEILKHLK